MKPVRTATVDANVDTGQPFEIEARADELEAEALRLRAQAKRLRAARERSATCSTSIEPTRLTREEYAARESVSTATVTRWVREGMPTMPVGSTYRIDPTDADAWRKSRGRHPTTPKPVATTNRAAEDVDVTSAVALGGLRVVRGSR